MKELTNKFYIVKGELIANIWRIPTDDVKRCVEQEKNLYIFDPHQAFASTTYSLFELDRYKEIDSVEFPVCYLEYLPETDFVLPQIFQVLSVKLHHNWMNLGFEYFTSQSFLDFLKEIQRIVKRNNICTCIDLVKNQNESNKYLSHGYAGKATLTLCVFLSKESTRTLMAEPILSLVYSSIESIWDR